MFTGIADGASLMPGRLAGTWRPGWLICIHTFVSVVPFAWAAAAHSWNGSSRLSSLRIMPSPLVTAR